MAAAHDGNWSVLVITEKGDCDRGYRYKVEVANGQVRYRARRRSSLTAQWRRTARSRSVISANGKGAANGTGRLTANSGAGTWRGAGKAECAGRWEAERR